MFKIKFPFFTTASLSIFLILIYSCNKQEKNTSQQTTIAKQESTKVVLDSEFPPANTMTVDLGILKMDANGHSMGKKTEMTELRRLIDVKDCEIIEINYELKGSYGDNIAKKIIYDKREKRLQDISTKNNVMEDYKNVPVEKLRLYLKKGEKDFYSLTSFADAKYDFNNREMKKTAIGNQPAQSEWDGSVKVVMDYIKNNSKDGSSIKFIEWSKVTPFDDSWVVRCKFKGANALGVIVTENKWFYIQNEKVVKTKDI